MATDTLWTTLCHYVVCYTIGTRFKTGFYTNFTLHIEKKPTEVIHEIVSNNVCAVVVSILASNTQNMHTNKIQHIYLV